VDGCEVYNNVGYGIQLFNGDNTTLVHDNILRNNRVHNNGGSSTPGGITINHGDNNIAHDNIICNNEGEALGVGTADNTQISNNTIYNNSPGGLNIASNDHNTLVRDNTFVLDGGIRDRGLGTIFEDNVCDVAGPGCTVVSDPRQLQDIISDTDCDNQ
jgi:parallel beta-helix repeat protein